MAAKNPAEKITDILEFADVVAPGFGSIFNKKGTLSPAFAEAGRQTEQMLKDLRQSCAIEEAFYGKHLRDDEAARGMTQVIDLALFGAYSMASFSIFNNKKSCELVPRHRFSRSHKALVDTVNNLPRTQERSQLLNFAQAAEIALNMRRAVTNYEYATKYAKAADRDTIMENGAEFLREAARVANLNTQETETLTAMYRDGELADADSFYEPLERSWERMSREIKRKLSPG